MTESYANKGLGRKMKRKEMVVVVGVGVGRQNGGGGEETHSSVTRKLLYAPCAMSAPRDTGHSGYLAWRNLYHYPPGERRCRTANDGHMITCDVFGPAEL